MPKELLLIVDTPLIQYSAEEAIASGIDTLFFVTSRNERAIEDHFDANNELETMLRAKGKDTQADMVRNIIFGCAPDADGGFCWERPDLIDALKAI